MSSNGSSCPSSTGTNNKSTMMTKLIAITVPVVASIFLVLLVLILVVWRRRREAKKVIITSPIVWYRKGIVFSYADITRVTSNFRTVIGKGGSSTVYYGELDSGEEVAVKKLTRTTTYAAREFATEVNLLTTVHHKYLVSLIGYCEEGDDMILVYEYMSNGNLRELLSGKIDNMLVSDWKLRLDIAVAAATGVEYLYHACEPPIIHRDVKSSNILLDLNFVAKLADFGFSKLLQVENASFTTTIVCGTMGYLDPEYMRTNKLTEKCDVYAFGVVLLEILTGQPPIIEENGEILTLIQWAKPRILSGTMVPWIDQRLQLLEETHLRSILQVADVAISCTAELSTARPNMTQVVRDLRFALDSCCGAVQIQSPQQEQSLLSTYYQSVHGR